MSTMLKLAEFVINEDHIVHIHLDGKMKRHNTDGQEVVVSYVEVTLSTGKILSFTGDKAQALRRWYKNTTNLIELSQQLAQFDRTGDPE